MRQTPSSINLIAKLNAAANCYSELMKKQYLIIYENKYIEVIFNKKHFKHLTGIISPLSAKDFFNNSKSNIIRNTQIFFDQDHPYRLCYKKLKAIVNLENNFKVDLLMLCNVNTASYIIPKGITDLNFVLGLDVNNDKNKRIIDSNLVPYTLRVNDSDAFENSQEQYQIDFIFSKDKKANKYSKLCYGDINAFSSISESIKKLIDFNNLTI